MLIWYLYTAHMNSTWPAGTAGHQLASVLLFGNVFLTVRVPWLAWTAWYSLLAQVVLVYVASFLHKAIGAAWWEGSAMSYILRDPRWSLTSLADATAMLRTLTWSVLVLQSVLPVLLIWKRTRTYAMWVGGLFHVCAGFVFRIPEMGLVFLVAYSLWLPAAPPPERGGRRTSEAWSLKRLTNNKEH